MKEYCPFCDEIGDVTEKVEREEIIVKKETIEILAKLLICKKCKNDFSTLKLEEENLYQAYRIYRDRNNLLSPEEMTEIRKKYDLGVRQLARLLGWSPSTISQYESGRLPEQAHNELLTLLDNPLNMMDVFHKKRDRLDDKDRQQIARSIYSIAHDDGALFAYDCDRLSITRFNYEPDFRSGNQKFDLNKFMNLITLFVSNMGGVSKTKLNKLPFYADFLHYKLYGTPITGMRYLKLEYGPVPSEYEKIFGLLRGAHKVECRERFKGDSSWEEYYTDLKSDTNIFSKNELDVIMYVISKFKDFNATQIMEFSHREIGYIETPDKDFISYKYASSLQLDMPDDKSKT
jgi:putative zinc finger/helix-turn-helix YgiT family protein